MSDSADLGNRIFINNEGEFRCGWRILVFLVVFMISLSALTASIALLGTVVPRYGSLLSMAAPDTTSAHRLAGIFLNTMTLLTSALLASLFCARLLERRSLSSIGYKLHPGWLRDSAFGLILGTLTLAVSVGIMAAAGSASFEVRGHHAPQLFSGFAALLLFFLLAAAFEEVLVRGFVFQALAHNVGPIAAIGVTSVGFSLLHIANPNLTFFSMFNTVLAGIWLGVAYWKTRSLWLATALHAAWNFAMAFIFGLPVSGLTSFSDLGWLRVRCEPVWLSGGDYGPEGGLAATASLALSTLVIWKAELFRASGEMIAALKHGASPLKLEAKEKPSERNEPA